MSDQVTITVSKRIVLKLHGIWSEDVLEETEPECIKLHNSISQQEFLRLCVMGVVDREGFITKTFLLAKIFIRPITFNS